jgi:hypothetical protein
MIKVKVKVLVGDEEKKYKFTLEGDKAESVERVLLAADRKDAPQKPEQILEEALLGGFRHIIASRGVSC